MSAYIDLSISLPYVHRPESTRKIRTQLKMVLEISRKLAHRQIKTMAMPYLEMPSMKMKTAADLMTEERHACNLHGFPGNGGDTSYLPCKGNTIPCMFSYCCSLALGLQIDDWLHS